MNDEGRAKRGEDARVAAGIATGTSIRRGRFVTVYVALLRAVNVGGTGRLAMDDLRDICRGCGYDDVRTYIASGNVIFRAAGDESAIREALERALQSHVGKPVGVAIRTAPELVRVLAANPFASALPNRTVAIFLDHPPPADALAGVTGRRSEEIAAGAREIYVHYPDGIAASKLQIRVAANGTARNMNTIAKLAALANA